MISLNDVLLAASNIPVDDPIAEIWGRGLQGGYKIIEYTRELPITISANGGMLLDYRIYGADGGVGEQTENLFDGEMESGYYDDNGEKQSNPNWIRCKNLVRVSQNETYHAVIVNDIGATGSVVFARCYNARKEYIGTATQSVIEYYKEYAFETLSDTEYVTFYISINYSGLKIALFETTTRKPYVPYGYKLPMTVYKQEFVVTNDMLDQSNWVLSPHPDYAPPYFIYFDVSNFINKRECDVKIYENFTPGYKPQNLVVALTDAMYTLVDSKYRILNNYGTILNKEFDFSSWDKIYLCIGYGNGYKNESDEQLKIDELFENWEILIAPTSQTREPPVYIGENQLGSVEGVADYVDKSSGKIVRMIGEYTFTGDESFNKYGNSDVFYTSKTIDPVGITTVNTITMRCNHPAFTAIENKDTIYWLNPEADDICCFLPGGRSQVFLRSTSNFTTAAECKAYLKAQYDNGTPVKISYWLKAPIEEDPPVPLPEIPTVNGETVIDYDGTPKPSQMYVKYKDKG